MKKIKLIRLIIFIIFISPCFLNAEEFHVTPPKYLIKNIPAKFELITKKKIDTLNINGKKVIVVADNDKKHFNYNIKNNINSLIIESNNTSIEIDINPVPLWLSIIPPLIAILLALVFKEVVSSLFIGILIGISILQGYSSGFLSALASPLIAIDTYILQALSDLGHLSIIIFSMLIGGTVMVISKNGGMKGIVNLLTPYAKNAKSGQLITWFLGIIIFFDDYANSLVVGNTMKPITDKLKISREKLSYLVDSTAAPIAAIAFITTWIGAELSYIDDATIHLGIKESAYSIFLNSLKYSFYPILTLIFILLVIFSKKEFGPMFNAEANARAGIKNSKHPFLSDKKQTKNIESETNNENALNAIIPIAIIVFGTLLALFYTGFDQKIWSDNEIKFGRKLSVFLGNSDSYTALLWASSSSLIIAIILSVSQGILSFKQCISSTIAGFKSMFSPLLILVLAWSLSSVANEMHTGDFITNSLTFFGDSIVNLLPLITFIMAALVAFSTGSSWGTMAILYPFILPASWEISQSTGFSTEDSMLIFYNITSCVLAGSVLGDHCSPISDTTILSSMASSCNHIEHVRTQMPYALTVGFVSAFCCTLPATFGIPSWLLIISSIIILYCILNYFGKKID